MTNRRTLIAALIAALVCPLAAQAAVSPYTPDGDTLHLWHFDDGSSPATPATGGVNLVAANGATLGNAAFAGFGTSGDTSAGDNAEFLSASAFAPTAVTGAGGAFTFEAMVRVSSITAGQQQIFTMEANDNADRIHQFRISGAGDLQFINIDSTTESFDVAIPTAGPNAFVANEWYHVAATYNGLEGTADNLKLFWTRVDESVTRANQVGSFSMSTDLSGNARIGAGNDGRTVGGQNKNLEGAIDEVRVSDNTRTGDAFIFSKPQYDNVLLADSFNTASTGINDDLASRQTGLLATTNYNVNGGGSTTIASNQLEMGVGAFTAFSPDVDFATGAAATAIANGGGFVIDFDTNPVSGANDTGGDGDWLAVSIGRTLANSTSTAPGITQGDVDFGLLVRDNGMLTLWDGGSTSITPSANAFDLDPTAGETYNIRLMVNTDDANSGTAATVSLFVNGVQFDLTDGAGLTYGFNWDANNTNYIAFESRGDPVTLDNLLIAAIPTPAALPAGLALMTLTLMRRRRK